MFVALSCTTGVDCYATPGKDCVADYCQPTECTATGQCVYGQKCSQNEDCKLCVCRCTYPQMHPKETSDDADICDSIKSFWHWKWMVVKGN